MWRGEAYRMIDTGGLTFEGSTPFEKEIAVQVDKIIARATVVLFVCDIKEGVVRADRTFAHLLKRSATKVVLVANKTDAPKHDSDCLTKEWFALGFGEALPISAVSGRGVGELLDKIRESLHTPPTLPATDGEENGVISATIIGKPNVGKSTLFNALIGEERAIVSPTPHTTRESVDTEVRVRAQRFLFVDTAGLRRKTTKEELEAQGRAQTIHSLDRAEVALLVLDAQEPSSHQDRALAGLIEEKKKGVVIVVNKWDLVVGKTNVKIMDKDHDRELQLQWKRSLGAWYRFVEFAPIVFTSALTSLHVASLYNTIIKVAAARARTIPGEVLERVRREIVQKRAPLPGKGVRHPRIISFKQVDARPPTFEVAIKVKTSLHHAYLKFLEHELRRRFDFVGTPIVIYMKKVRVV